LIAGAVMGGEVKFAFDASILVMVYICVASIVSYCIWYEILKKGELSKLFIIKFAEPVFACVFGALILGEDILKIQYLVAFILISGGICISNFAKKKD
jgi:drug/metabolite transporter (DMT)-like permease